MKVAIIKYLLKVPVINRNWSFFYKKLGVVLEKMLGFLLIYHFMVIIVFCIVESILK